MKTVYVFLAEGFEEIEALTPVDLFKRAGVSVKMVAIGDDLMVTGSHGISVKADQKFEDCDFSDGQMLVLPGGMPGTLHLKAHEGLRALLNTFHREQKMIGAICAAPSVLGELGILQGRRACCYPGFEEQLTGAKPENVPVVIDGHLITSRGMGTAIEFGLALITQLKDQAVAEEIRAGIIYQAS